MNELIERLAREACDSVEAGIFGKHPNGSYCIDPMGSSPAVMARFAELVAEECAKALLAGGHIYSAEKAAVKRAMGNDYDLEKVGWSDALQYGVAAIRALFKEHGK